MDNIAATSGTIIPETAVQTAESFAPHSEECSLNDSCDSNITRKDCSDEDHLSTECSENNHDIEKCSNPSSLFTSGKTSYTSTPRRNSFSNTSCSSCSDLGTSLNFLFHSRSTSTSTGSHCESPTANPPDARVLDGLDRLLNRITSDRFLELRRIQLGERPVTSGNARTSLESFFQRAINGPTVEQRNAEEETNRPENVANDVQSLLQLSRVRSALQNGFSRRLESTLNPMMNQRTTGTTTASRRNNQPSSLNNTTTPHIISPLIDGNVSVSRRIPTPPPPPSAIPPTVGVVNEARPSALQSTVDASVEMLAESIATDITRLQSLQVVSSMLRTDFRSELESLVQQRVDATGNGTAVADIIRSLPRSRRAPHPATQSQPITQQRSSVLTQHSSRVASEEIQQLRQQVDEMKRMMAMSMEMQLETQRAIRQEVSAVFTAFMQDYLLPASSGDSMRPQVENSTSPTHPPVPITAGQCAICIDRSVDTVLYQCGHMCVCHQCGMQLKLEGHKCPMCRAPIRDVIRAYKTQESRPL